VFITHHPLFFIKPQSITSDTLIGKKVLELIKNGINVYSSHTNLDVVEGGLNDVAAQLLGFKEWQVIEPLAESNNINNTGIGRLVTLTEALTLIDLCNHVKTSLGISNLKYAGKDSMLIKKIAVINGSGKDYFDASKRKGADCIITGDTSYHYVSDFVEQGIAIIDAGHFETEWPAMKVIAGILESKISSLGCDNPVFLATTSISPYKYI
jgi:dinuclear metal center YbgI/SA1388 family protein